jgi:signal transduction histidine kinase
MTFTDFVIMRKNSLFNKTRLQIAGWYAAGTGTVLVMVSAYFYLTIKDNYSSAIYQEVAALAGTLHDALEPKLQQPGVISDRVDQEIIPNLCIIDQACRPVNVTERHSLGVTQQAAYYLRFYNLQEKLIAQAGVQPSGEIAPQLQESWQSIYDTNRQHYHRFSTVLTTIDGRPWGFLQVGRSMKESDERLANLQLRMGLILPALMLFIAIVSWWVAGRTMKPIYSSYQKMQQFTADAAHELRTPLMALQSTVELMQYYEPDEYLQQKESLAALDRQTQRLIQLTQDLLMLSRLDDATDRPQVSPCCLNQAVPALVEHFQSLSRGAGIDLKMEVRTPTSLVVNIDRTHLERLLTNLVANAIDHTPPGGTITIRLDRSGNTALLQVIDTGVGMSTTVQEQVFDRFYRADGDRGRQSGGAGLGLAIVRSIIHSYGGTVQVRSQLQAGSTFLIELPLLAQ